MPVHGFGWERKKKNGVCGVVLCVHSNILYYVGTICMHVIPYVVLYCRVYNNMYVCAVHVASTNGTYRDLQEMGVDWLAGDVRTMYILLCT